LTRRHTIEEANENSTLYSGFLLLLNDKNFFTFGRLEPRLSKLCQQSALPEGILKAVPARLGGEILMQKEAVTSEGHQMSLQLPFVRRGRILVVATKQTVMLFSFVSHNSAAFDFHKIVLLTCQ
jgi:hypothetical protein